ncbi:MAG: S41 family peptidase [Anaerolineales bacterium]|nr:S41 family peptidase [Anaerolineales bacterium]
MTPRRGAILRSSLAVTLAALLGLSGGVLLDREVLPRDQRLAASATADAPDWALIQEAWGVVDQQYVDRSALQPQAETYGAIEGLVASLGDTGHSRLLTPPMLSAEQSLLQGEFEGIGAELEYRDGHAVILAPLDGSPAEQAGLRPGDVILAVDGVDVSDLPLDQVVERILGPAGTTVTLRLLTPASGAVREVSLTRAHLTLRNVSWQRLPGTSVAHVRIAVFSQGVSGDLRQALVEIQRQGLTGVILDLRNDPGGLLDEAVGVASQFLRGGNVLLVRDAAANEQPIAVKPGGAAPETPLAVLVNQGTASAAEIVAGALQDAGRATLVGETTFGTGTVLNQFPLSDGSALLLATHEWLTPLGRTIWHHGIEPDAAVPLAAGASLLIPDEEKGMSPAQLQTSGDGQLLAALDNLERAMGAR